MNELLDQFILEARELAEAAAGDLLALERAPGDAARLDGAFRAVSLDVDECARLEPRFLAF